MSNEVTLHFRDPLGIEFSVVTPRDSMYDVVRSYGREGCTSGVIPAGGLILPLANEEDFDWSLLGARRFTFQDQGVQTVAVWHRGFVYKRRELPANPKMNMGAVVKYSRGAKQTDDPRVIEGGEGDAARYVTLVSFRGEKAHKDARWVLPS